MPYKKFIFYLMTIFTVITFGTIDSYAKIRTKRPKFILKGIPGYDTNLLRVSSANDTNRIAAPFTTFKGRGTWWVYWSRSIRSFIFANGDYTYYMGNSFANKWSIKTSIKTAFRLLKKDDNSWRPGLDWHLTGQFASKDQLYSDRALGEEFFVDIIARRLNLSDLFDRNSYEIASGVDIDIKSWLLLYVGVRGEINDYKNIVDTPTGEVFSLDNTENAFEVKLFTLPASFLEIIFKAEFTNRLYDHKVARTMQNTEIPEIGREYYYQDYRIYFNMDFSPIIAKVTLGQKLRDDLYQGYFDYSARGFKTRASYLFASKSEIRLGFDALRKDYDNVTLGGKILSNTYNTFEIGFLYKSLPGLTIWPSYIYESESSTYSKFEYHRHIVGVRFEYFIR